MKQDDKTDLVPRERTGTGDARGGPPADSRAAAPEPFPRRAIVIGLACAGTICAFGYFHDSMLNRGTRLIPHLMPPVVYGGLVLAVLGLNPLLRRLRASWQLRGRELALITALALVACSIPFYGLVHCWPTLLMLPHHFNRVTPGWQQEKVLELVPERMLADVSAGEDVALNGYRTGLAEGDELVSPLAVPWSAWVRTLAFWVPLVLCVTLAMAGLAVVLHVQWSRNEHLPYPISSFAHSLLPGDDGRTSAFGTRSFWITGGFVFGVHMVNYACTWWPDYLIRIPLRLDFSPLCALAPTIVRGGPSRLLFYPRVMFSVIGIAYFFSAEVSFSLAAGPVLVCYVLGVLAGYGYSMYGGINYLYESTNAFLYLGGYFGIFVALAYTGRHHYVTVFRRSLGLSTRDSPEGAAVWGMRLFLVGGALFCAQLIAVGVDGYLAVAYAGIATMVFVVVSRALAETGGFYVGTWIMPAAVLLAFMGGRALGPGTLVVMAMVGVVVMIGPGWAPMPFVVQALQLTDLSGIALGRTLRWAVVVLVVGVLVALPATIYCQYSDGALSSSGWAQYSARLPFDVAVSVKQRLAAQGTLETASQVRGLARFGQLSPNVPLLCGFGITALLAGVVSLCRLRFPWWPLHPVIFFFLHSHQIQRLAFSFFLAWVIKASVSKYGGVRLYRQLKPAMVGLVAGEVVAAVVPVVAGIVYRFTTGESPVSFSVFLL